ncbi:hypothetical protein VSS74_25155 [Conexibacter stalactiti]|uniref:Uncharacterized protein n=1 Tax=Conexibacter stalactiti TaxID=1940611 RepID=A0ABU4I015_9ACTN|nr:hypothetical protein [Conexibacter stalactiti]MDW5597664.1 hypothetical protein [Conexibacter stalactiti]MEC5038306.1 hypothetical protein [Conexibacter stalactiti]
MHADPFTTAAEPADGAGESAAAGSTAAAADSPLARLRAAFDARRSAAELFLPIPGWEGALVARVTVPDHDFVRSLVGATGTIDWMADFVAATVTGLYEPAGVDDEGEPQLTALEGSSGPLRFDTQFGAQVGLEDVSSARAAVQAAFTVGGDGGFPVVNVVALAEFANKIDAWLNDTSREVAEAIVPGR